MPSITKYFNWAIVILLTFGLHGVCHAQTAGVNYRSAFDEMPTVLADDINLVPVGQDTGAKKNDPFAQTNAIAKETSSKKFPEVAVTGFFHLDAAYFHQDDVNRLVLGDINDGLGFRRARLAAKGNVNEMTSYIIELDIAQSQARFVDVWMQLNQTAIGNIRVGRFRQPFGMSELTSVRNLPFLERSVLFSQSPFRQTGIMLFDHSCDQRRTWAVSGYRSISDNFGNVNSDNGGYGLATRWTTLLAEWGENEVLHVGVDYSVNDPGSNVVQVVSTNEVFVGQNPNFGPSGLSVLPIVGVPPFVNTGAIPANTFQVFNIESAVSFGRLLVQSEARWMTVDRTANTNVTFPAVYIQARYMLTGESIPYVRNEGVFGRVSPFCEFDGQCGFGAWELLGRISHIELNDGGVNGRRMTNLTTGCNWYLNNYTKLQFNWIHTQLEDPVLASSQANTFAVRAQLDF